MKMFTKRGLALALAIVMVLSLAACTSNPSSSTAGEAPWGEDGKPFTKDTTVSIVVGSHASWPYNAEWKMWQYLIEGSGATVDVDAIVGSDYATKINLMFADSDSLPDLLHMDDKQLLDQHASAGGLIAIDDHLDEMPNYTKALNEYDPEVRAGLERERKSADGKVYWPVVLGTGTVQNAQGWLYRKDILEKHNLAVPKTLDELVSVCRELKKLYPESYPFCPRGGGGVYTIFGPMFQPYLDYTFYYDFTDETWKFGPMENGTRELVEFMVMMQKEGLAHPNGTIIDTTTFDEYVTTGKLFFTNHYLVRQSYYNVPMQETNPEFEFMAMVPPTATRGEQKMGKTTIVRSGLTIPNTKNEARIGNAIRFLDYMYSDTAKELLSWGKEGETYNVDANGNKAFILEGEETVQLKYGAATSGLLQRVDELAYNEIVASGSPIDPAIFEYTEDNVNPSKWLSFNDEERAVYNQYFDAVSNYASEWLDKFVLGIEPLTDETWNAGIEQLKKLGVNELLEIYNSAWERVK
ncbi:MAG: extracellular solute-binding protein [Oscillospiraceae bacterium]|nr:extracellular solute-binding protein [Oscillospiraceae bacterium]